VQHAPGDDLPPGTPVWPAPPQIPRLSFLYTISLSEDIGIAAGWLARLVGSSHDDQGTFYVADNYCQEVHAFDIRNKKHLCS
jgi:hypothetical protein